ncbi:ARM REPEAT PROTEIN INTERACTING WITH ABF2 [Hibiscus syriacus]|uniref:ARM REPEAT PROTEIN INTERACTING WITH ABF2 n=1 Tax=Hibiscus syriacus TaxID=106335 RepID=A0A6A3AGM7_HIBSY|nr:ARM REPEAT PROTEIN INTERACTING WITH ABF2 [Hibiscus syriacus]
MFDFTSMSLTPAPPFQKPIVPPPNAPLTYFLNSPRTVQDIVDVMVECGVVPALLKHIQTPTLLAKSDLKPFDYEVEKSSAFALGLLAFKDGCDSRGVNGVIRKAAGAITNLSHENVAIKTRIRIEGRIPPLVELLEYREMKVQRAAAGTLKDVGVIGNLVHSYPNIKKEVLLAGALQPVIGLLSSSCLESQREAALLIGQFAADSDCKVHIVQRGAVPPLIEVLMPSDVQLKEMSAFVFGRLAQDTHNQAGIVQNGAIVPLLDLTDSKNGQLQHNSSFSLCGLADNEDNVVDLVRTAYVQILLEGEFIFQTLNLLFYLMRTAANAVKKRVALTLAHLSASGPVQDGSEALYKLATKGISLSSVDAAPLSPTPQVYLGEQYVNNPTLSDVTFLVEGKRFYAHRICLLASSDSFRAMFDGDYRMSKIIQGLNTVDLKVIHRRMTDMKIDLQEREAKDVEIPNIRWDVFVLMMRYIYTGSVTVEIDLAQELLRAADQYILDDLKRLCEYTIAQVCMFYCDISTTDYESPKKNHRITCLFVSVDNVMVMNALAEAFNATTLREACLLFILEQFEGISTKPWYAVPETVFDCRKVAVSMHMEFNLTS